MIKLQIDLSKPGYADLAELLSSYAEGDSVMIENVEGRVAMATPDFLEIDVERLDMDNYEYDVPSGSGSMYGAPPEGPDALA
jgi:hypothetical protein